MSAEAIFNFSKMFYLDNGKPIVLEPWQIEILKRVFGHLDAAGRRIIRDVLVSTGKKSGKTELLSLVVCYMLLADSQKPNIVLNLANDKEQAGHAFLRVKRSLEMSPPLAREVIITPKGSTGWIWRQDRRGYFKVVASDLKSSGGERPSMLGVDEIGQFKDWEIIAEYSPGPEREEALTWMTGFRGPAPLNVPGAPLHDLTEGAKKESNPRTLIFDFDGNPSPRCTQEFLETQRKRLPSQTFERVWMNRWTMDSAGMFTFEQIEAVTDSRLHYGEPPLPEAVYLLGLDLGLRHDRTVLCVAALDVREGNLWPAYMVVWQGSKEHEVNIDDVEREIRKTVERYDISANMITLDPWQASSLAQRLSRDGILTNDPKTFFTFAPSNMTRLARGLYSVVADRRLRIPDDAELKAEFMNLVSVETSGGQCKWDHPPGAHDDRVMALALSIWPVIGQWEDQETVVSSVFDMTDPLIFTAFGTHIGV